MFVSRYAVSMVPHRDSCCSIRSSSTGQGWRSDHQTRERSGHFVSPQATLSNSDTCKCVLHSMYKTTLNKGSVYMQCNDQNIVPQSLHYYQRRNASVKRLLIKTLRGLMFYM